MRLEDWRELSETQLAALLDRECERWATELFWDAKPLFALIQRGRDAGELPGLVAFDGDRIVGWCYGSVFDGQLHIGALHGERADNVRALLDGILAMPEASYVKGYRCFVFPDGPAVTAALARRRFEVQPFLYLVRGVTGAASAPVSTQVTTWSDDDLPEAARLLARAYAGTSDARCFAPTGRLDQWAGYLAQLVRTPACGVWAPGESLVWRDDTGLGGVLLASRLAAETTHVAQVVVDPSRRRRGIAAQLIATSARRAVDAGAERQTLLVSSFNDGARALYDRLGFAPRSAFLFADRVRITRSVAVPVAPPAAAGVV